MILRFIFSVSVEEYSFLKMISPAEESFKISITPPNLLSELAQSLVTSSLTIS
jgi:hypothetical protein